MSKLYIIGNGFDLAHGIESSYEDFFKFIADGSKYGQLSVMLDDFYGDCGDLWSDFETTLGLIKGQSIHRFAESEVNAVELDEKDLYRQEDLMGWTAQGIHNQLADAFTDWVNQINIEGVWKVYDLDKNAQFLTFNYTQTLEHIYKIQAANVMHIHLCKEKPIFGHGLEEYKESWPKSGYESVLTDMARDRANELFTEFKKPVSVILERNEAFFDSLSGKITDVHVIGHSLAKVDMPYFSEIHSQCPNAIWNIYYYDPYCTKTMNVHHREISKKLAGTGLPLSQIYTLNDSSIKL